MHPTAGAQPATVSSDQKRSLKARLARVEGQLRGIQRMIDREEDCEAIAQQVAAARGALNRTFAEIVSCALEHRLLEVGGQGEETRTRLAEITRLIARYG